MSLSRAKPIYLLEHSEELGDVDFLFDSTERIVGCFDRRQDAVVTRQIARNLPGFRDQPNNFRIDRFDATDCFWAKGFKTYVTNYDTREERLISDPPVKKTDQRDRIPRFSAVDDGSDRICYVVHHTSRFNDDEDRKLIGVYRSIDDANAVIQKMSYVRGFRRQPERFTCTPFVIGFRYFQEGFTSEYQDTF